ncbi:MAG: hypothetical protein ACXV79_09250 [Methylobacter sp.]
MNTPLKPCRECGHMVSKRAKTCPNCGVGKPVKNGSSINHIILALIFGWLVWFYVIDPIVQGYKDRENNIKELRLKKEAETIRSAPLTEKSR